MFGGASMHVSRQPKFLVAFFHRTLNIYHHNSMYAFRVIMNHDFLKSCANDSFTPFAYEFYTPQFIFSDDCMMIFILPES